MGRYISSAPKGSVHVTPERIPKRPHGESVNRRRILAIARKTTVLDVEARIIDNSQARVRLTEIDRILSPEDETLSIMTDPERDQTRTGLEIERIWLQLKLDIITQADKQRSLEGIFKDAEENKPDVYNWLFAGDQHGLSMPERIRDKVFPPIYVGKYYTKR